MKKSFVILITLALFMFGLTGCSGTKQVSEENVSQTEYSMFIEVENGHDYYVAYHKDTKVMYAISDGAYNRGAFITLLNADGTPMLYEDN